jgi:hypothetical protein
MDIQFHDDKMERLFHYDCMVPLVDATLLGFDLLQEMG